MNAIRIKLPGPADDTCIWPGHDYSNRPDSTVNQEKKGNPHITDYILATDTGFLGFKR